MFAWLSRWYWGLHFKDLRKALARLESKMQKSSDPGIRAYYAQTGPERMRIRTAFLRASQLPEPQRTKFILHIVAQMYLLSASYSGWFDRICRVLLLPQQFHDLQIRNLEHYNRCVERVLQELVTIYNREQASGYAMLDFLNLPLSPGLVDLISLHEEILADAETKKSPAGLEPIGSCNFEMELNFLEIGLDLLEMKAGTPYFNSLITLDELSGIGHLVPRDDMANLSQVGKRTLQAIEAMVQTAYERSV